MKDPLSAPKIDVVFRPLNHRAPGSPKEPVRFADARAETRLSTRQLWNLISELKLKTWKRSHSRHTWLDMKQVRLLRHRRLKTPGRKSGDKLAKLTWDQVSVIRGRYGAGGVTQAALGKEFGVTQNQVSHIVRGEQWKRPR